MVRQRRRGARWKKRRKMQRVGEIRTDRRENRWRGVCMCVCVCVCACVDKVSGGQVLAGCARQAINLEMSSLGNAGN